MKNSEHNKLKKNIQRCFNKAASTYDQHCGIQKQIGEKLIDGLIQSSIQPEAIIDLGCGSGLVTEQLANQFNYKHFYAIDMADQLLLKANQRLANRSIAILENDFDFSYTPDMLFDLAFSNMSLHWSLDLEKTFSIIRNNLTENGMLAFSVPIVGTFSEFKAPHKNIFYLPTDIYRLLKNANFNNIEYKTEKFTLNFDSQISAIKSIKYVGANQKLELSKKIFPRHTLLEQKPFSMTYHIAYFIVKKN